MNPPPRPHHLQPFASASRQCSYVLSLCLNVPCTCFSFFFVPSVAISRGLISNPTMAPETRCFTEIYCDKASRPSPRGDRSTRLGSAFPPSSMHTAITVLIIITTGGTHTHRHGHKRAHIGAVMLLLHNHGRVIIPSDSGQMEGINNHCTLQNMCHAYLAFHNSHNSHPATSITQEWLRT